MRMLLEVVSVLAAPKVHESLQAQKGLEGKAWWIGLNCG